VRRLARRTDMDLVIRSGRRTCAEQQDLYAIGRSHNLSSAPVTYAAGCRSWHVLGRAVDLYIVDPATGNPLASCAAYEALGELWEQMGGVWGGRFSGFGSCGDAGHFEWHPGTTIEDFCPDPSACSEVEARVVRQIGLAKLANVALAFGIVTGGAVGAWYIMGSGK
jgi:hypothetical protein